jgi:hypothetical protein
VAIPNNEYRGADNPHECSLGKFLRALTVPVGDGYVGLRNGQIITARTLNLWKAGRRPAP